MTALTVTPSSVSANDIERGARVLDYQTGEAITKGQAVYLDSSNLAWRAKSDSAAHARAVGIDVGADNFAGETSVVAGGWIGVAVFGPVNGFSGLSQGQVGWVGANAGEVVDTAPSGGAWDFQLGHAVDDQTFFVDPGTSSPVSV